MDFNKYTQKSLEAVQSCQSLAVGVWESGDRSGAFTICITE